MGGFQESLRRAVSVSLNRMELCILNVFRFHSGLKTRYRVFPGATDSRYVRHVGIPALGFSPINNTPLLLHDHDEFLRADTYLNGIEVYKKLIPAVANA